ncbi:MAG: hypothetical protein WAV07_15650 [Candidatus Contendobacter sp.]
MTALADRPSAEIERLTHETRVMLELGALAYDGASLQVSAWLVAKRMRREGRDLLASIQHRVHTTPVLEIDPDDLLSDQLLALQQSVQQLIIAQRQHLHSLLSLGNRWLARWTVQILTAYHRDLGLARTWVLEHDADVSPVMEDSFESAEDLIAALKRDAA